MVEEHCWRDEAVPEGAVECQEERMPELVARERWESSRPNIQGFQGKADLPWVSRGLRRGRNAYPMDSRLRFLHYLKTELWGHLWRAQARNGKPRASEGGVT